MTSGNFSNDIRYQVFLSSTYVDLQEERRAVMDTLLKLNCFPAGMELFPSTDGRAWEIIERVISTSDYYLLVIGGKYGSTDENDVSFTEKEYNFAMSLKIPVLAFIHSNPNEIILKKSERSEETRLRLESFVSRVEKEHHVNYWSSAENLASNVVLSFINITRDVPAIGWVKANRASSTETIAELGKAQIRIRELEDKLKILEDRAPKGIENLRGGSDPLQIDIWARGIFYGSDGLEARSFEQWIDIDTTWDTTFKAFAINLLVETTESEIQQYLENWLVNAYHQKIFDGIKREIKNEKVKFDAKTLKDEMRIAIEIDKDYDGISQIKRILLQFKTLGLIERKSANAFQFGGDRWVLTQLGELKTAIEKE